MLVLIYLFVYLLKRNINFAPLLIAVLSVHWSGSEPAFYLQKLVCVFLLQEMATGRDCHHDGWAAITINSCLCTGSTLDSQGQQQQQRIVSFSHARMHGGAGRWGEEGGCQRELRNAGGWLRGWSANTRQEPMKWQLALSAITSQLLRRYDDSHPWTSFSHSPAITMETSDGS